MYSTGCTVFQLVRQFLMLQKMGDIRQRVLEPNNYLLEVWTFLDYRIHRNADVEDSVLMPRRSIIESLQLMLIVYCLASGMSEGGRAHLRVIKTTRLVF